MNILDERRILRKIQRSDSGLLTPPKSQAYSRRRLLHESLIHHVCRSLAAADVCL
ncbi:MAG: hypothetical protein ACRCXD_00575 [Luteolibacter sp.]